MNTWQEYIKHGLKLFLQQPDIEISVKTEHLTKTPERFLKALVDLTSGGTYDPKEDLVACFEETVYNEMIMVGSIPFSSLCCHHLLAFTGYAWFGYIPDKHIVGLSKIARIIDGLSARPQVQERLTAQIVEIFQEVVKPLGCGLVMEAEHSCMSLRGVKKHGAKTMTTHLCGAFKSDISTKQEFLAAVNIGRLNVWH